MNLPPSNSRPQISRNARRIFIAIIAFLVFIFVANVVIDIGETLITVCCGGIILIVIIGIVSERGMRGRIRS